MSYQYKNHLDKKLTSASGKGKNMQDLFSNLSGTDISALKNFLDNLSQQEINEIINEKNQNGETAIKRVCINGNKEGLELLLSKGAKVQTSDFSQSYDEEIKEILMDAMAEQKRERTPFT